MGHIIHLPRTMARWPIPRRTVSPFYEEVAEESAEWFRSFNALSPSAQKAFDHGKFGLLVCLICATDNKEHFRAACNLMILFFAFDDYTDELNEAQARAIADICMDVLQNPSKERPREEAILGEIMRRFWTHFAQNATSISRTRFISTWDHYTTAVAEQARDRDGGRLRTVEQYMVLRRLTIGHEPFCAAAAMGLELPEEVYEHPLLHALRADVVDIVILDNDMVSYNKERATGDDLHNVLNIAMHEYDLDIDGALEWLAQQHRDRVDHAISIWPQVLALSFSPQIDLDLAFYVDHLMNWPRGQDSWNFESGRYFGRDGLRVQKERTVQLSPKIGDVKSSIVL
ncbi:terpenoid synthase [Fomes fomentarius]|nr:terpenoid synthase [Fomes fomentarius]